MEATIHFLVVVYATVVIHNLDHNTQGIARSQGIVKSFVCIEIISLQFVFFVFCSLLKPEKYSGKRRGGCTSEISTIGSENQVKTYMDSSNGVRNASSNAYNKVRASAVLLVFFIQDCIKKCTVYETIIIQDLMLGFIFILLLVQLQIHR